MILEPLHINWKLKELIHKLSLTDCAVIVNAPQHPTKRTREIIE